MRYEIFRFDGFLEVRTYGDAELQGFKDFLIAVFAHEYWHPGGALLINHSELNSAPLTIDNLRALAFFIETLQAQIGQAKIAILVARDLEYGIGRMWEALVPEEKEYARELFRSRDEAISWLVEK